MRSANEIRQEFIDYFVQQHQHTFVPSASVVPVDDKTLFFTNAGMNQFKDVFLNLGTRPYRRAANTQKCIRASGKHNDLDDVGRDTYHHTYFEMLGNWSFGDYYKAEAIRWAWELLTKQWGLDKSRLHATVFGGDAEFGLEADTEAEQLWQEVTDIDPKHIHRFGKKDNFWMMGETGPCGPCTEIHVDRTPDRTGGPLVNASDAHVMEIWNLVFIQYNRDEAGKLTLLPAKHVDTGMGFERIVAVLQDKSSNYDTDVFAPILAAIGELTGRSYQGELADPVDTAFRVIADHLRMASFAIADGALPGANERSSVLRSVIRRAVRFGWQIFEFRDPFLYKLVPALVAQLGPVFPELETRAKRIQQVLQAEEGLFLSKIEQGLKLFASVAGDLKQKQQSVVPGKQAFDLYATYGFPKDLTEQMAQEAGLTVDQPGYEQAQKDHAESSKNKKILQLALNVEGGLPKTDDRLRWQSRHSTAKILGWIRDQTFVQTGSLDSDADIVGLILDQTPFYAESGGQIGDRGQIETETGLFEVTDTIRLSETVVHLGQVSAGVIQAEQAATATVATEREWTRTNHTATHLLHWALRTVLGEHVEQRGSKVTPELLTFDFPNEGPVTPAQQLAVERIVNEQVSANLPVVWEEVALAEAKKLPGVRAFFGDKYGDVVRVVRIGDGFSTEFCGGTHLEFTGQIGLFKIVREEGIGQGNRRITAKTAKSALEWVQKQDQLLSELMDKCRCAAEELPARVDQLQAEVKKLKKELERGGAGDLTAAVDALLAQATTVADAQLVVGLLPTAPEEQLRNQLDRVKQKLKTAAILFAWPEGDDGAKVGLLAGVTQDLADRGLHAGHVVGQVAEFLGGKGGGRPTMARAGGQYPDRIPAALELASKLYQEKLQPTG